MQMHWSPVFVIEDTCLHASESVARMICPMCRDSFRGLSTPAPEKSKKMEVENLFMLADKETSDD